MKKDLPIIQLSVALIVIFLLIGGVGAGSNGVSVIKMNGGAYDHSKYTVGTDTATVSKEIGFTVSGNGGKFAYTASGPVSATSKDGNVTVNVTAMKLAISGKTSGSGVATANATILATGTANADGVNVFTIVESETSVDTGSKLGSAEASAYASGDAKSVAAYEGVALEAGAEGTTSAYGKVTSPKAWVDSEGEILGVARYTTVDGQIVTDPFSEVESEVEGTGTATASATANGHSEAILIDPVNAGIWIVNASGNTAAIGTSKYTGYFYVEAEVEALSDLRSGGRAPGNKTWADIWTDAYTAGNDKYAQATGKATVKSGLAGAAAVSAPVLLVSGVGGNASASSSIHSIGWADSESEIYAESSENGHFGWWDNFEELGYEIDVLGRLVDDTWIWSYSGTGGETVGFTGSAAGSADGGGLAAGYFIEQTGIDPPTFDIGTSGAIAGGAMKSSATAKNLGWADAESSIVSVDAIDAMVYLDIWAGDAGMTDAKVPVDLDEVGLQQELDLDIDYYAPVFEASAIQQTVSANGKGSSDTAEAKAQAGGITSATGTFVDMDDGPLTWIAATGASGAVKGIAQANMCTDPTSTSVIAEFDSAIWEDSELDIAIVGSASYANGKCGYTAAEAAGIAGSMGSAGANDLDVSAYAAGEAETMAQANNANSLALAGIASGSYAGEEDMTILGANGTLIDASIVGSAALTFGASGTAAAEAVGTTSASGNVLTADEAVSGGMSTIIVNAATESDAYVKNGIAFDAAAVTSFGVMQLGQSGDILQDNYANGVNAIVDVAFAEAAKKTDIAKASGEAAGSTRFAADFFVNDTVNEVTQAGTIKISASGAVRDAVEAVSADPLAASVVTSFGVVNGEPVFVPSLVVDGSLVGSLAMADGDAAKAAGEAEGYTFANAELLVSNLNETGNLTQTHLLAQTETTGETEAYANANGGLALSIAGDGAVSVVLGTPDPNELAAGNFVETERKPTEPLHAILLGDLVELTPEQHDEMVGNLYAELGQATKYEYVPANVGETACELWYLLDTCAGPSATATADPLIVDGSLSGAASFVVGKGGAGSEVAGNSGSSGWFTVAVDQVTETSMNSFTDAAAVVETDVSSMNGIALAAGGAGSLDVVVYEYGDEEAGIPPTGDLIEASLLGDIAFADAFGTRDTAWSKVSVAGETSGSGAFVDDYNNASAETEAVGRTTGYTKATYMDPLSISVIGAISNVEADATTIDPPPPAAGTEFEVEDTTFIVTLSTAAGKGTGIATGTADGEAEVVHAENLNWYATGGGRIQQTDAISEGSFKSGVEVTNGIAVAAAGANADGEVDFELPGFERSAESDARMFAYTGGRGAVIKANATVTDANTLARNEDYRNNPAETFLMGAYAASVGDASSSIYALNSGAESLAMAVSEGYATHEGEPANAYAQSFFGVQMLGDNGASQTVRADMSDIDVSSETYARNGTAADARFTWLELDTAGANAILQPKVNTAAANAWNDYEDYDFSLGGGVQIGGFADVNTNVDPNFAYAFRYGKVQGQGGIPPDAVPADFIVLW